MRYIRDYWWTQFETWSIKYKIMWDCLDTIKGLLTCRDQRTQRTGVPGRKQIREAWEYECCMVVTEAMTILRWCWNVRRPRQSRHAPHDMPMLRLAANRSHSSEPCQLRCDLGTRTTRWAMTTKGKKTIETSVVAYACLCTEELQHNSHFPYKITSKYPKDYCLL